MQRVVVVHGNTAAVANAVSSINGVLLPRTADVGSDHLVPVGVMTVGDVNVTVVVDGNGGVAANVGA